MKFKYNALGFSGYTAEIKNTKKGIEISEVSPDHGKRAEGVLIDMLSMFKPPYSDYAIRGGNKAGIKLLKADIEAQIKELESGIERLKLASKMCSRKTIYFKD